MMDRQSRAVVWTGWIMVALYAAALLVLSVGTPGSLTVSVVRALPGKSAGAHVLIYLILALLLRNALGARGSGSPLLNAFVVSVLYGGALELFQAMGRRRTASLADFGYNAIGALAGCAIWFAFEKLLSRRSADGGVGNGGDIPAESSRPERTEGTEAAS